MQLKEAVPFLKGAVARSMPGGAASRYIVNDGWLYAQSPAILAAFPVPHMLGLYALAADDLEGALARMTDEPTLEAGDGTLIFRSGRLRSTIQLMETEPPATLAADVDGEGDNAGWEALPDGFAAALETALPFASKDGTWQRGIRIETGRIVAINNRCSVEVSVPALMLAEPSILASEAVEYLGKLDEPARWRPAADHAVFVWPSTAWVRVQALAADWPDIVDKVLNSAGDEAPIALSDEWHAAFADAAALGDGNLAISPSGILARSQHAEHDAAFATGCERQTFWSLEALKPVFAVASAWHPDAQGAARFIGPGLRGCVVGQRR